MGGDESGENAYIPAHCHLRGRTEYKRAATSGKNSANEHHFETIAPLSPLSSNSRRSGAAFPQNLRVWDGLDGPRGQHRPLIMLLGPSVEGVGGGRKIETLRCAPINPRREHPSPILPSPSPTRFRFPFHSSKPLFHSVVPLYLIFCLRCCSSPSPLFPILSIVPFLPKSFSCFMSSSYPCLSVLALVLSRCLIVLSYFPLSPLSPSYICLSYVSFPIPTLLY